jgi:hypothetical protein
VRRYTHPSPRPALSSVPSFPRMPTDKHCSLLIGSDPSRPTLVAIKGTVFDVTRNAAYGASGQYRGEFSMRPTHTGFPIAPTRLHSLT